MNIRKITGDKKNILTCYCWQTSKKVW